MLVKNLDQFNKRLNELQRYETIAIDAETTGLHTYKGHQICGISFACRDFSLYAPVRHQNCDYNLPDTIFKSIGEIVRSNRILKVFHNAKFDLKMLMQEKIDKFIPICDTAILTRLISENEANYKLKYLAKKYIDKNADNELTQLKKFIKKLKIKSFDEIDPEILGRYAEQDARLTLKLFEHFSKEMDDSLYKIFDLEHKLIFALIDIENTGFKVDKDYLSTSVNYCNKKLDGLRVKIYEISKAEFNILSPSQTGKMLLALGIKLDFVSSKGNIRTDAKILENINKPITNLILEYRFYSKLLNTYFSSLLEQKDEHDLIHANFRQYGTRTGRFSCTNPNLQNIPRLERLGRVKTGKITQIAKNGSFDEDEYAQVRKAFITRNDEYLLFFFDYAQMEFRLFAEYSNDKFLIRTLKEDKDIHIEVAKLIYKDIPLDDKSSKKYIYYRSLIKTLNFGVIYGMGVNTLSRQLKVSYNEAQGILRKYFRILPSIRRFIDQVKIDIQTKGFVENAYGRKRHLSIDESYKGLNSIIQSVCADMIKEIMVKLWEFLKDKKSKIICQIHDELILEIHCSELHLIPQIKKLMEMFTQFSVPIKVDVSYSKKNWLEKEKYETAQA